MRDGDKFGDEQKLVADSLTSKLAGKPGLLLVDRDYIEKILKEQNLQNSDRFSADTAVRIGKLAGASDMILVGIDDYSLSKNTNKQGSTTTTTGTVVLRAEVRILDVSTGVIVGAPTSSFQDSKELAKATAASAGVAVPYIPFRPRVGGNSGSSKSNGDPQVIMDNLNASAIDAVSAELAAKLSDAVGVGAAMSLAAQTAKVAGVAGGLVYIAAGSATGVKPGQRFQVVHMADTGLVNPDTNQHIMTKQNVCIFVVVNVVDDSNSSGSCDGGLPKSGDIAQRIP